jgi:hypothetical protein
MAFCSLIYSIDDVVITDMSEEGLRKLSNELQKWGTNQSFIKTIFERIKKKNDEEMQFFFPEIQEQGKTREYLSFLKKRCLLLIDQVLNDRFIQEEFKKIDEQLLKYANPNEFHGNNSIEINYEKRFTEMNVFIEALAKIDPLKKTVLEYYELLKFLKKNSKYLAHG